MKAMNQREFTRVALHSTAQVRFGDESITGEIENLSLTGTFVKTPAQIPVDTEVQITIMLAGASSELSVNVKGKVVRTEADGFGVRFVGMNLDSFFHLRSFFVARDMDEDQVRKEYQDHIKNKGS
jgi:hypothetical protein